MSRSYRYDIAEFKDAIEKAKERVLQEHNEPFAMFSLSIYNYVKNINKDFWKQEYKSWSKIYITGNMKILYVVNKKGELDEYKGN